MRSRHQVLAYLSFLIAIFITALLTQTDSWPITSYPMFSRRMGPKSIDAYRLIAIPAHGAPIDFGSPSKFTWFRYHQLLAERRWPEIRDLMFHDLSVNAPGANLSDLMTLQLLSVRGTQGDQGRLGLVSSAILSVDVKTREFHEIPN